MAKVNLSCPYDAGEIDLYIDGVNIPYAECNSCKEQWYCEGSPVEDGEERLVGDF